MDAVDEDLVPLQQPEGADDDVVRFLAVRNGACADGDFRLALSDFQALSVQERALLTGDRRRLVLIRINRRKTEQLCNLAHKSNMHLSFAIRMYSAEISIPTDFLPSWNATRLVVPLPVKGSSTIPLSGHVARIGILQRSSG